MKTFTISENKEIDFKIESTLEEKDKALKAKKIANEAKEKIGSNFNDFFKEEFLPEEQKRMLKEAQDKSREFFKQFGRVYIKKKD